MSKKEKTQKPVAAKVDETPLPEIRDAEGQLRKLKAKDFPKTKLGKMAYCDYNVQRWLDKKAVAEKGMDPAAKKKKRREKLKAQLAALDAELADAEKKD